MVNSEKKLTLNTTGQNVARYLLNIGAINFRPRTPYILTAGWASPVYIDCRKVISHITERRAILNLAIDLINEKISEYDLVAGGETAGIPYAAWVSDLVSKPMLYIRKKPKGFARMSQIEGDLKKNDRVLLVEDLATDGGSKVVFVNALREAGAIVNDLFVIFYYGVFPGTKQNMNKLNVNLHYLCDWWDVLEVAKNDSLFTAESIDQVQEFLENPTNWSKQNGGK
tara:strand:- start:531 stop:1208 length:678 start_codon:yes stop_codon:yes gene_type:complete